MKRLCHSTVALVVLMTFIGCGGGGSTSQSLGANDDFAALLNEVAGPQAMSGTTVLAVGGGKIEGEFTTGVIDDATFSFFAGYHKNSDFKGNFVFKRVFTGDGVRGVKSTEITDIVVGEDEIGRWVIMEGIADWEATWTSARPPDHTFRLQAWDIDDGMDMIWLEVRRPPDKMGNPGTQRPAATLAEAAVLIGGNIMIR